MSAAATPVMPGTRAPADGYADGRAVRAHDGSRHAARDSLKLRMLLDPEARKAARLDYQKKVDAAQAEYTARHARPKPDSRGGDQRRGAEQLKTQETAAECKDAHSEHDGGVCDQSHDL